MHTFFALLYFSMVWTILSSIYLRRERKQEESQTTQNICACIFYRKIFVALLVMHIYAVNSELQSTVVISSSKNSCSFLIKLSQFSPTRWYGRHTRWLFLVRIDPCSVSADTLSRINMYVWSHILPAVVLYMFYFCWHIDLQFPFQFWNPFFY